MPSGKMHPGEPDIDSVLVHDLITQQFPRWAGLPLSQVASSGTDNAMYRLGDDMAVRLPRRPEAALQIDKEALWLPALASRLPVEVPVPLAKGDPGRGYPWPWTVSRWLDGRDALVEAITDLDEAARALAEITSALSRIDTTGGPPPGPHNFYRGVPLVDRDGRTREAIASLPNRFDKAAIASAWDRALEIPRWDGDPTWIHGDLAPGNLLVRTNRVVGVLDWGGLAVADPACDLMIAWTLFVGKSRETFKKKIDVDEATWNRARGWTLSVAAIAIPYYLHSNPSIVRWASDAVRSVLSDPDT